MIEIKEDFRVEDIKLFLEDIGAVCSIEGMLSMTARERGEIIAVIVGKHEGKKAHISDVFTKDKDDALEYGMGKSILNLFDLRGAQMVYCENEKLQVLLEKLRFKRENEKWELSLLGYFDIKC